MTRKSATISRPTRAARFASLSESFPSVAEIAVWSSVTNLTGSAPVCSTSARSLASRTEKLPLIWAPFDPEMPFGYCVQSIWGHDLISRSSTIAKCWVMVVPFPIVLVSSLPRCASARVISSNFLRP